MYIGIVMETVNKIIMCCLDIHVHVHVHVHVHIPATHWNPSSFCSVEGPGLPPGVVPSSSIPGLPPGIPLIPQRVWSEHENPDGRIYFYNKVTRQSVWEKPKDLELVMPLPADLAGLQRSTPSSSDSNLGTLKQDDPNNPSQNEVRLTMYMYCISHMYSVQYVFYVYSTKRSVFCLTSEPVQGQQYISIRMWQQMFF